MPTNFASTTVLANLVIPAYDRLVTFGLRETPSFRSMVDRRPVSVTNPGDTVYFTWYADMATTVTPLSETVSPDSVAVANPTRTSVVVNEYGTWIPKSLRLQKTAFTQPDMEIAELLARQQGDTLDALVKAKLDAGTNTAGTSTTVVTGAFVRTLRNQMRRKNVSPRTGTDYITHIHPDQTLDLMSEVGTQAWQGPHTYGGDTANIYAGEVGRLGGIRFVENTRCTVSGTGSSTAYKNYTFGAQALVEASVVEPHTVIGPQTDALNRLAPIGWYGFLGWSLFRPEALIVGSGKSTLNG